MMNRCRIAMGYHPVETQAGDRHRFVASGERVALLFTDPLGQTVWIFVVGGMLLVQREIVVPWPTTVHGARRVHTRSLAHSLDAEADGCAQGVVTSDNVVVVDLIVGEPIGRWNCRQVDQGITTLE